MLMRDEWLAALHTPFRRCQPRPDHPPQRRDRRPGQSRNGRGPRRHRAVLRRQLCRRDQGTAKGAVEPAATVFRTSPARSSPSSISAASAAIENIVGQPVHPLALPRQPLCRGLAGLARVRPARPDPRDRRHPAEGREADHPLRRRQCRSGHRRARPRHPAGADAPARPQRMRHLCRGDRRRHASPSAIRSRRKQPTLL